MREMKDSGIEWVGRIPIDWKVTELKREYSFQTGWTPDTKNESFFQGNYAWANISDLKEKKIFDTVKHISDDAINSSSMCISPKGSLMFAFKLSVGAVSFCGIDMYTNEAIATFLAGNNSLEYLFYIAPLYIVENANENIYGAKLLNQQLIRNAKIVLPPLPEQKRLADYLDRKCSAIDNIISKQEQIIEKLKEYKLSLITEAVTKGLDHNAEMKDSGIDICDRIPKHWRILQIRYLYSLREERNYKELSEVNLLSLYTDLGVFPHGEQEERGNKAVTADGYKIVYEDDIIVNIILAWMGAIGRSAYNGVTSPAYDIYKPYSEVCSRFFHYLFRTKVFAGECYKYGRGIMAMRWRTYSDEFRSIRVPVPPYGEQTRIADYLDSKCETIDKTIADRINAINKLQDYKKSLIYEVVPLRRNTRSNSRANSVIPCRSARTPSVILPVWITLLRDFLSVWR